MSGVPVGLLLAAGLSRRFGKNKLLQPIQDDGSMLMICAQKLATSLPDSIVVINADLIAYTRELESLGLRVIVNEQAQQGMGSSIACGVRTSPAAAGWLITLADMPYLKPETIRRVVERLVDGADIVAPVYNQQRGHPVGFGQCFRKDLLALNDDKGARRVIARYQDRLETVITDDAGVIQDVDQPGDLITE